MCPVLPFNRAENGYAVQVSEWIANPHAYFKSFGPEVGFCLYCTAAETAAVRF